MFITPTPYFFSHIGRSLSQEESVHYAYQNIQEPWREGGGLVYATESIVRLKKAQRWSRIFSYIPYVRMVAVVNSAAMGVAKRHSDIDLFLVAEEGHVWTSRFFLILLLRVCGQKVHGEHERMKFCISFCIDTKALDMSELDLPDSDPYLDFWMSTMKPVYDDGIYTKFREINSIKFAQFPHWDWKKEYAWCHTPTRISACIQRFLERCCLLRIVRPLMTAMKKYQQHLLASYPSGPHTTSVVIEEHMVKLHDKDVRLEIKNELEKILGK